MGPYFLGIQFVMLNLRFGSSFTEGSTPNPDPCSVRKPYKNVAIIYPLTKVTYDTGRISREKLTVFIIQNL